MKTLLFILPMGILLAGCATFTAELEESLNSLNRQWGLSDGPTPMTYTASVDPPRHIPPQKGVACPPIKRPNPPAPVTREVVTARSSPPVSTMQTRQTMQQQKVVAESVTVLLQSALEACESMNWKKAETMGLRAGNIQSASPVNRASGFIYAGIAAFVLGDPKRAQEHFTSAIRLCPNCLPNQELLTDEMMKLYKSTLQSTLVIRKKAS